MTVPNRDRLSKIYTIFVDLNYNNFSREYYYTKILFNTILRNGNNQICYKLLRHFHNSFFCTKKISIKFDRLLITYRKPIGCDYLINSSNYKKNYITNRKYISFFNMFTFTYDQIYSNIRRILIIQKKVTDMRHIFRIPYKINNNIDSKLRFSFIIYYLIKILYQYHAIIIAINITYYFNTGDYYSREVKLISKSFKTNTINNIDETLNDFKKCWKNINLDEYYSECDTKNGEFHIQLRLKYAHNIVIPKYLIVPLYKKLISSRVSIAEKYYDFKIINKF